MSFGEFIEMMLWYKHLNKTELAKAWEHAEQFKNVGPTVNQFVIDTLFAKLHEITAERDYYRNRIEELEKENNND